MLNKQFCNIKLLLTIIVLAQLLIAPSVLVSSHPLPNGVNHNTNFYVENNNLFVQYNVSFYYTDLNNFYNSFDTNQNRTLDDGEEQEWINNLWTNAFQIQLGPNNYKVKQVSLLTNYDEIKDAIYPTVNLLVNFGEVSGQENDLVKIVNNYKTNSPDPQDWNFSSDTNSFALNNIQFPNPENIVGNLRQNIGTYFTNSDFNNSTLNNMPVNIYSESRSYLDTVIRNDNLSIWAVVVLLFVAVLFGCAHTLTPGHGKAIIGTYMAAIHGTLKDAIIMAVSTTLSHTGVVIGLGLTFIWLRNGLNLIIPLINFPISIPAINIRSFVPFLNTISGVSIIIIGLVIFRKRVLEFIQQKVSQIQNKSNHNHNHDDHDHGHNHNHQDDHGHNNTHSHDHGDHDDHHHHHDHDHGFGSHTHTIPTKKLSLKESISLGLSTGLTPCLDAVAILILAINLDRAGLGIAILLAFSIGMGVTLTTIGWVVGKSIKGATKFAWATNILDWIPMISALLIALTGVLLLVQIRL